MAKENKKISTFLYNIGYWAGFIISGISFFGYTLFSFLAKFPGLAFFANPLKVGFAVIANLSWVLSTTCEAELGLREPSSIGKRIRDSFFNMSEYETIAGISGVVAAIAVGLALAFPPSALVFAFTSAVFMCFSNAFWTQGEESRLRTLISKEPNKELHSDIEKAHKQQVKYAGMSTVSSIMLVVAISSSILFPPLAPIAVSFSIAAVIVASFFKIKNLYLNAKISHKRKAIKQQNEVIAMTEEEVSVEKSIISTELKAHVDKFCLDSRESEHNLAKKENTPSKSNLSKTTEYETSKESRNKLRSKLTPTATSNKKNGNVHKPTKASDKKANQTRSPKHQD